MSKGTFKNILLYFIDIYCILEVFESVNVLKEIQDVENTDILSNFFLPIVGAKRHSNNVEKESFL